MGEVGLLADGAGVSSAGVPDATGEVDAPVLQAGRSNNNANIQPSQTFRDGYTVHKSPV
jgi:hypothetical protein